MVKSLTEGYMQRCFDLARQGGKAVRPNPNVGALLVHKHRIIGEGYHAFFGGPHAEVNCLNNVPEKDKDLIPNSKLFVSLEPCNFSGKTPACSKLIIDYKIPELFISSSDPNPRVNGKSIDFLKNQGIKVNPGILEEEGNHLIRYFSANQLHNRPYIILKIVKSEDNYIGKKGEKIWLSNQFTSVLSHKWRSEVDGIMVGTNTLMNDNPGLANRLYYGHSPTRIILDRKLKAPKHFNVFDNSLKSIIINEKRELESDSNIHYLKMDFDLSSFIQELLDKLFAKGIYVLLVEGGSKLIRSFLREGIWDEARIITTGKLLSEGIKAPNINGTLLKEQKLGTDHFQIIKRVI